MPTLPPEGSISIAMAAVYSVAYVLQKETNFEYMRDRSSYLYGTRGIMAQFSTLKAKSFTSELMVDDIYLLRHDQHPQNPFMIGGVGLDCSPRPDPEDMPKEFGPNPHKDLVDIVQVYLRPPYNQCLSRDRISSRIPEADFITSGTFQDSGQDYALSAAVDLPPIEDVVIPYLRQAMASDRLKTFMLEEDGGIVDLPSSFWRTDKAEIALEHEHPISVRIGSERYIGQIFTQFDDLNGVWGVGYDRDRSPKRPPLTVREKYSPYLEYMISSSSHLGLVDGMNKNGGRLKKDEIERWLSANWPAELGKQTPSLVSSMATFLRHPDAARGGNMKIARADPVLGLERQRSEPDNS